MQFRIVAWLFLACWASTAVASRRVLLDGPSAAAMDVLVPSTNLRCCGPTPDKRACLATNLYYNIQQRNFVVLVDSPAVHVAKDYNLHDWNMSVAPRTAAPDPDKTLIVSGLNVFWPFTHFGSWYSIGHALLHELFPLYQTLNNLLVGHVPRTFNLMVPEESLTRHGGQLPRIFTHITPAVRGRQILWGALCQNATNSGKEWIRLEAATLGNSGLPDYAWRLHGQQNADPNMFNNVGLYQFRNWMLESAGIDPGSRTSDKPLVVLNHKLMPDNKTLEDRRRIYNIEEVEKHLQRVIPDAEVKRVAFMTMSWRQQLTILSETSVFITTEGSSGFRLLFLPPGASAIVLAHPDNTTEGAAPLGYYYGLTYPPFHEVSKYFQLTYVRIFKYHVDVEHTDQYVNTTHNIGGKFELYDAHIVVQLDRITTMVKDALQISSHYKSAHESRVANLA